MRQLCLKTLEEQGYNGYLLKDAPERVLQFGEGNFLRAFTDYFIDVMNEKADFNSKVVICQPGGHSTVPADRINAQQGLYTLLLRGYENGKKIERTRVISCVSRCLNPYRDLEALLDCAKNPDLRFIICNTTEAGIVYDPACQFSDAPASSYPGKLTRFLYERFVHFGETAGKGFYILACELIDHNGDVLKDCVLRYAKDWNLDTAFIDWIQQENIFCSTLVDRIVTGYPKSEADSICQALGYQDSILDTAEVFASWVIEGPETLKDELPFEMAGLPILLTQDHTPYKQRKVRILNGAHTSFVLGAYLAGFSIVRDCMNDPVVSDFLHKTIQEEIIPTLSLPKENLEAFASAVIERFQNPFIDHSLLAIALNSTSKWKVRVLPSLKGYYERFHALPSRLTASFAFYLAFYQGSELTSDGLNASCGERTYQIQDDRDVLTFFYHCKDLDAASYVHAVCTNQALWGEDLSALAGFETAVTQYLILLQDKGAYEVMRSIC